MQQATELIAQKHIGAAPVVVEGRLVGIFSERDLLVRVVAKQKDPRATKVAEVVTRELIVAHTEGSYQACLQKMQAASCRHLPVLRNNQLAGIVSMRDLLGIDGILD